MRATNPVVCGRHLFDEDDLGTYHALKRLEPGLMLDVGAAAGFQARTMLKHSPGSHILAFEPFRGNWEHFEKVIDGTAEAFKPKGTHSVADHVTLVKKAVTDHSNGVKFHISSTIPAGTGGFWGKLPGYSSVGRILGTHPRDTDEMEVIEVASTTIDDELGDRTAVFAKIDVQGGESAVIRGAARALREGRIKVLLLEYRGQQDILDALSDYAVYDTPYLIFPKDGDDDPDFSGWEIGAEKILSTGRKVFNAWPDAYPADDYAGFFTEQRKRWLNLETDLLFVHPSVAESFHGERGQ